MTTRLRRALLSVALFVAVLLLVWAPADDPPPAAVVPERPASSLPVPSVPALLRPLPRQPVEPSAWPLFGLMTSAAAPEASQTLPSPPAPSVPPARDSRPVAFPYVVLGRWHEDGRRLVFLQDGERAVAAGEGDVLGGAYRIEQISSRRMVVRQLSSGVQMMQELGEELDAP